jgi:hypothetical protein
VGRVCRTHEDGSLQRSAKVGVCRKHGEGRINKDAMG